MGVILDGKALAARLKKVLTKEILHLRQAYGLTVRLAAIQVGDHPASTIYVQRKREQAEEIGIHASIIHLPASINEARLFEEIERLNTAPAIHGILVQMPLPSAFRRTKILEHLDERKDVDGLHPLNLGRLMSGDPAFVPCTPLGCALLLKECCGDLTGLHALVVGCSILVGQPMAQILLQKNCTVTMAHVYTRDLAAECRRADIIVVAVGSPHLIKGDWIKPGAIVLDVGINRLFDEESEGERLLGDVDFEAARLRASAITPVPGGVGPMTVACLLLNTVYAAARQNNRSLAHLPSHPLDEISWL
jgi:methylenetetrahydrofolate dehydrogenase (NADP+)/methenyltetrahydrofolate cyclohydrolase